MATYIITLHFTPNMLLLCFALYNSKYTWAFAKEANCLIGKRIVALRNEKGFTQQLVAEAIGISRATYAHYEIDRREPNIETLRRIAMFFDVSADYLLGITDLRKPYVLDRKSSAYKLAFATLQKNSFTPADAAEIDPDIAKFMQENGVVKAKTKMDLIDKSGISLETIAKVIALIHEIKKESTD